MPYNSNADLPDSVKKLPQAAQTIWQKAFNAALQQYDEEETAFKVAWAAVKEKYKKSDDKWVLKESLDQVSILEAVARRKDVSDADKQRSVEEYGDVEFADETNKKYPIDTEEHIRSAWNYINKEDNADKYSATDLRTIKARIVAAWKEKIDEDGPPLEHSEESESVASLLEQGGIDEITDKVEPALKVQAAGVDPDLDEGANSLIAPPDASEENVLGEAAVSEAQEEESGTDLFQEELEIPDEAIQQVQGEMVQGTQEEVSQKVPVERAVEPVGRTAVAARSSSGQGARDVARSILLSHREPLTILTEERDDNGHAIFRVRGVALVDDAVSANGYYYSGPVNDRIMEETNSYIDTGGKATVYSRHEKAKYGLPVGKVDKLERSNVKVYFEARIANTTEGKDVQVLITEGVLGPTSIRSTDFQTKPLRINGKQVMAVERAILHGIDLVEQASIEGAGITEILSEGAVIEEVQETMDWETVSLDDLRSNRPDLLKEVPATADWKAASLDDLQSERPDLLEEYDARKYDNVNKKIRGLEEALEKSNDQVKALTAEQAATIARAVEEARKPFVEQVNTLQTEVDQRKLNEAIAEAVADQPHADLLEAALRHGMVFGESRVEACEKAEDLTAERLASARALVEAVKQTVTAEEAVRDEGSFRGNVHEGEGTGLTTAQARVLGLCR